ncbi:MAG: hypothetical protein LKF82_08415 [Acinetobacter populi]|jgi:hypothetical protein|uniref:hypothetical protein n=1 Tax=Acinetobacter populi TaxID=1582270 RepID=UPI0023543765|nr:hypothetical protein [Acinetobacter populi]MCH4247846.1 hypothetical protein [Acinetobacter populi]
MKYAKTDIVKALLLAPIPLLVLSVVFVVVANREYHLSSIFVVSLAHCLVYFAYCILTVPFSFLFSILLNRYSVLNLLTISISALVFAIPFFMLFAWGHTGQMRQEWWKMYTDVFTIFMALFPGVCYWLFLIYAKRKSLRSC